MNLCNEATMKRTLNCDAGRDGDWELVVVTGEQEDEEEGVS